MNKSKLIQDIMKDLKKEIKPIIQGAFLTQESRVTVQEFIDALKRELDKGLNLEDALDKIERILRTSLDNFGGILRVLESFEKKHGDIDQYIEKSNWSNTQS